MPKKHRKKKRITATNNSSLQFSLQFSDTIRKQAACRVIQEFYDQLSLLPLYEVAPALYTKHLIKRDNGLERSRMNYTKNEKCQFILEDVLNTLEEEPDKIEDFTNVLALLPQARNIPVAIHDSFPKLCGQIISEKQRWKIPNMLTQEKLYYGIAVAIVTAAIVSAIFMVSKDQSEKALIRSGLPSQPVPFVGREDEFFKVLSAILNSSMSNPHIVTITGPPAHGKTALATTVGYKLIEKGYSVYFVPLDQVSTMRDARVKILSVLRGKILVKFVSNEDIYSWSRYKQYCVVILDGVDSLMYSNNRNDSQEFDSFVDQLVKQSKGVNAILTTQYHKQYLDDFTLVHLPNLTLNASLTVLQHKFDLPLEKATLLAESVEGIPLALKIVASLLSGNVSISGEVDKIILKLQEDPIPTLSHEHINKKLSLVFDLAISYLKSSDRVCFEVSVLFPYSFTKDTAEAILRHFNVNSNCLHELELRSLLQFSIYTKQYHFPALLQSYGRQTVPSKTKMAFADIFIIFYMKESIKLHSELPHESLKLAKFLSANSANFLFVLENFTSLPSLKGHEQLETISNFSCLTYDLLYFQYPLKVVQEFWFKIYKYLEENLFNTLTKKCYPSSGSSLQFVSRLSSFVLDHHGNSSIQAKELFSNAKKMFLSSNVSINHLKSCSLDSVHLTKYMVNMARFFKAANNSEMYNATLKFLLRLSNETDNISDADLKIGSILMALGEYKEAITFLEAARAINSEELTIAKLLVDAYINIDEKDNAMKSVTIALNSTYALYNKLAPILNNTSMAKLWTKTKKFMQFEREYNDYMQTFSDMFFTLDYFHGILAIGNLTSNFIKTIQLYDGLLNLEIQNARLLSNMYCLVLDDKSYIKHQHSILEMLLSRGLLLTVIVQIQNFNILTLLQSSMSCSSRLKSCKSFPEDLVTSIVRTGRNADKLFANVSDMFIDEIMTKKMEQRRNLILKRVKKSQFTLVNTLASVYYHFGNITEAKSYTQRASDLLPYMDIDKKIHFFIQYQLQLAYYEFLLGNFTGALELFENCSLTINNEKLVLLPNAILYPKKEYGLSISSSGLASLKMYSLYKQMFDILKDSPSSKAKDIAMSTLHMEYTVTMIIFILMLLLEISLIFITLEMHFFLYSVFSRFSYVAIGREMCVTYVRNCKFKLSNIQAWNYSFSRSKRIYSHVWNARNLCFIFMLTLPLLLIPAGLLTLGIQWYLEVWSSYYNVTQFNLTVTCMELLLS